MLSSLRFSSKTLQHRKPSSSKLVSSSSSSVTTTHASKKANPHPIITEISNSLFPSSSSSTNTNTHHHHLSSHFHRRRTQTFSSYIPILDSISSNCSLQFCHLLAPCCSVDTKLSKELQLFLLADNNSSSNSSMTTKQQSYVENNDDDDKNNSSNNLSSSAVSIEELSRSHNSSPATSMLVLDLEVPSIVASATPSLQRVAKQLLEYSVSKLNKPLEDIDENNNTHHQTSSSNIGGDDYFTELLTSIVSSSSTNSDSVEKNDLVSQLLCSSSSSSSLIIPSHLYPALLAFSPPSICSQLIDRDVEARLGTIMNHHQVENDIISDRETTTTTINSANNNNNDKDDDGDLWLNSAIGEDERLLMKKISEQNQKMMMNKHNKANTTSSTTSAATFAAEYHHQGNLMMMRSNTNNNNASSKAPIDPVTFLKLFGSILRNPSFSREDTFVEGHKSLVLLATAYSAQLPPSDSFSSATTSNNNNKNNLTSSSSSFHGTVRNVVTLLLIRLSRLYGRPARALEFAELHRSLRENVPWMISMAPMLYWTWLLGSTLDAARSSASSLSGAGEQQQQQNSAATTTTIASSLIVQRLLNEKRKAQQAEAEEESKTLITNNNLTNNTNSDSSAAADLEAISRLWASFVPNLQEAVTIATSRLLDEASRKIRTTCIKVAILLDEHDTAVANRCETARKMGVPFTFQRLLQVYNTWGYHTVFFPNNNLHHHHTHMKNSNNNNNTDASSSAISSWSIDPKEATSQVIRLFGVALRRGCVDLMIKHPAEFERPLLDFIEQINVDRPFALMDATSHVLSILSEVFSATATSKQQKEGITKVATRVWEWLRAVVKNSGRGGWDPQTISPIADSLESLQVLPKSPFWWQCGCGARNPSASIRCTMCLRRSASGSCHWTCTTERCKAKQFIDSSALASDSVRRRCVACGGKHPWLATLEKNMKMLQQQKVLRESSEERAGGDDDEDTNKNDRNVVEKEEVTNKTSLLLVACSKCLQVQHLDQDTLSFTEQQQIGAMIVEAGGTPLINLCGLGKCNINSMKSSSSQQVINNRKRSNSSSTSESFVANTFLSSSNNNNTDATGLGDLTSAVNNNINNNSGTSSSSSSANDHRRSTNSATSTNNNTGTKSISWTCHECSTESTTPACSTCGLARDERVNMWCCDECGSWNFGDFPRCRRGCATKKRSTQRPVPYVRWTCGCGATNPMWRLSCGRCCPRNFTNSGSSNNKQQQQQNSPTSSASKITTMKQSMYTCPTCEDKPTQTHHRRIRNHLYRPGFTINSCGLCGADHPRDMAVVRCVNFERPCVSCGDWHTLPGLSVSSAASSGNNSNNNSISSSSSRRLSSSGAASVSNTSHHNNCCCCSHCGCETEASAEPFSRWNCESCAYEAKKKKQSEDEEKTTNSSNHPEGNKNNNATSSSTSCCWRTGYRCDQCGDLHPALAYSVIRNGIAARLSNGDPHDAVFLWKCQGTDIDDPDSCCGQFNPSWDTKCVKCGQIRYVPPPMMTKTSPCHGGSGSSSVEASSIYQSSSSKNNSTYHQNQGGSSSNSTNTDEEIRARYLPWSCDICNKLRSPEDVLFCPDCMNPRTPPPCNVCGGNHISLYCPEQGQLNSGGGSSLRMMGNY